MTTNEVEAILGIPDAVYPCPTGCVFVESKGILVYEVYGVRIALSVLGMWWAIPPNVNSERPYVPENGRVTSIQFFTQDKIRAK